MFFLLSTSANSALSAHSLISGSAEICCLSLSPSVPATMSPKMSPLPENTTLESYFSLRLVVQFSQTLLVFFLFHQINQVIASVFLSEKSQKTSMSSSSWFIFLKCVSVCYFLMMLTNFTQKLLASGAIQWREVAEEWMIMAIGWLMAVVGYWRSCWLMKREGTSENRKFKSFNFIYASVQVRAYSIK